MIDATEAQRAVEAAAERQQLDDLVRRCLSQLTGVGPDGVDEVIREVIGDVAQALGADRAVLVRPDTTGTAIHIAARWDAGDEPRSPTPPAPGSFPSLEGELTAGRQVAYSHTGELPDVATPERELFASEGLQALLAVPVSLDRGPGAALLFASSLERVWPTDIEPLLDAVAHACWDALERCRLGSVLRETLDDLQHLVDSGPVVIWRAPGQGYDLDWVTENTDRLLGYGTDHIAHHWSDLVLEEDRRTALAAIEHARTHGAGEFIARFRHADGSERTWHVHIRVEFDEHGDPVTTNGYSIDVTERYAAELRQRDSQRLEALGQLAGSVAHDFNNLLTVIHAYVDLEARRTGSEELQEALRAAEQARRVIGQLLTFSQHEEIPTSAVDLNACVTSTTSLLSTLLGADVEVDTDLDPLLPPVSGDPVQLEQVIANLTLNAGDAMPQGGRIQLRTDVIEETTNGEPGGRVARLQVTDTGVGMPPEVAARAFDPFFTTKTARGGTGLGLATVYGAITSAGGSISIDSVPGEGTCITALLPFAAPATPIAAAEEDRGGAADAVVLVVEDEPQVLGLLATALDAAGHTVLTARDAESALEQASGRRIDLIVTDVSLPGRKGQELVEELRAERPDLRAIFMSGYQHTALAQDHRASFLQKPFSIPQLTACVAEALG